MLEEHRARLTDSERDNVRRRATASRSAAGSSTARRSLAPRGRAAITSVLAAGLLMTSGGAALGVSALSDTRSARAAQYGVSAGSANAGAGETTAPTNAGAGGNAGTLGGSASGDNAGSGAPVATPTRSDESKPVVRTVAQAPRQLESGDSQLPFTGYVSGFVLLVGLGTLAVGLTLRRGTRIAPPQT